MQVQMMGSYNASNTVANELSVIRKNSIIVIMLDDLCDRYYEKED